MVGLSHVALRLLVRDYLPAGAKTIWPTEMLNSRRLPKEDFSTTPETMRAAEESELVPQILGNEEEPIAKSVDKLAEWGAEGIDINMGCPVQKALKHNYGVALMGDANYAAEVVRMTVRNTKLPVSVKLRAGHQNDFEYLKNFVRGIESAGASWICLHPRTAAQKRRGSADWNQIRMLRHCMELPLIGNGDVQTAEDVFAMLEETGCDAVMAGRALAAKPWMMSQVAKKMGYAVRAPEGKLEEGAEYGKSLLKLLDYLEFYFSEPLAVRKFKFHVRTTCVWLVFGHSLFAKISSAQNFQQLREVVSEFFLGEVEMSAKTQLRE